MEVTTYSPLFYLADNERSRPRSPDKTDGGSVLIDDLLPLAIADNFSRKKVN